MIVMSDNDIYIAFIINLFLARIVATPGNILIATLWYAE